MVLAGSESETNLGIVDDWADVVNNISTCRYEDAVLGIACTILLLLLRVSKKYQEVCECSEVFSTRSQILTKSKIYFTKH
jgi:hypothetical protein